MRLAAIGLGAALSLAAAGAAFEGAVPYEAADTWISAHADELRALNQSIWSRPELGLEEHHASGELIGFLEEAGFQVQRGVAGMPTAFVATAGSGRPIIGLLAEYDALPGMSQAAEPRRKARPDAPSGTEGDIGHACGHSIFGTASTGAAAAAWHAARESGTRGTIRLYGTPAEETGIGKVYMARAGLFDDLDAALHWHAGDRTRVSFASSKAVVSVKFRFEGLAAHASKSPHEGRSALDAVELMNIGVNYLREHVTEDARIHYVITEGGGQPNVVPPQAEVWYYIRADRHREVERILDRVRDIARGAALMTRTTMREQIDSDSFELLPNRPLSELLQRQLDRVGPPRFDERERVFARETQSALPDPPEQPLASEVDPLPEEPLHIPASTDVGNVSWSVPTSGLRVASYTLGAPGHSWQIVACTGMSIGEKGMLVAARALAGATLELLAKPEDRARARKDFERRRAERDVPVSVLPEGQGAPATIR
jgi:aminobenzoyl-glutamate utilization protein B